jgi:outer membrane lipoprotein SlyB
MRKILFLICVLAITCASWAQVDQTSWTNLSTLHAGERIQVIEMNSKKHSGTFVSFSETAIAYQDNAGGQTIPKQNVRRVKLMENKHHLRNALIGGAVGAGAGAGIGAGVFHGCTPNPPSSQFPNCVGASVSRGEGAAILAPVGFLAGGLVGAFLPSHHTIYSVNSH